MRVTLFFVFFLAAGAVFPQGRSMLSSTNKATLHQTASPEDAGNPVCGTSAITDEEIRKAVENTRLHKPEIYALMQQMQLEKSREAAADTIGAKRSFFVNNRVTNTFDNITAQLRAKGPLTQVWVDTTEWGNRHVTQTEVEAMFQTLENRTPAGSRDPNRGIVNLENEFLGNPPDYDRDGITDFLIVDIKDGWEPGQSFIAGFFTSNDQAPRTGSNARDMLYIDSYPTIFFNDRRNVDFAMAVLAHEYQHLIHHHYDTDDHGFVNEGLSELAMILCGYQAETPSRYLSSPDVPLFTWTGEVADYSRAALFTLYYHEQLGDAILKTVVQQLGNNEDGLRNAFSASVGLEQMIENWHLANYLKDRNLDPRFGYIYPTGSPAKESQNHADPNQSLQGETVHSYAADYVVFPFGDSLKMTFLSGHPLRIKAIKLGPGLKQIADVPLSATYAVPEFGNTVNTVVFVILNNSVVQSTYSYNATGKTKGVLAEHLYDDGTPDRFSGNAAFLGFGNNRKGYGWAVKFAPEIPTNQLAAAKIFAVFDQEFSGSPTPPNAPKDFLFHVWNDSSGFPGRNLIPPFIVSTDRTSTTGREFLNIDLSAYASALKNLGPVYIGFTEDNDDTVGTYVGMDSLAGTSFSYAFSSLSNRWVPFSGLSAGGTLLGTWNMMMRASFVYSDPSTPRFAVGYFQNPIFSERLDVITVAKSALNRTNLSGTFSQGTSTNPLSFFAVPNAGDQVFVDNNVTLTASGTIQVRVRGTTKYGFSYGDTTYIFNVQFLESARGGVIAATDGRMEAEIPQHALSDDMFLIAAAGNAEVLNAEIENSLRDQFSRIYTLSPVDHKLAKPAALKMHFDRDQLGAVAPEQLTIAYWEGKKWVALPSTLASADDAITAEISKLGRFALARRDNLTAVDSAPAEIPFRFALYQNYPNPFNPAASIRFDLPANAFVALKIYDIFGREVRTLMSENKPAGSHQVIWDGTDNAGRRVGSGIYFYKIAAGEHIKTMKMVLAK